MKFYFIRQITHRYGPAVESGLVGARDMLSYLVEEIQ